MEMFWWSCVGRSYGGILRRRGTVSISRVIGAEYAEIGFEFLISSFSLSVGLRVVGGGESYVVVEETC